MNDIRQYMDRDDIQRLTSTPIYCYICSNDDKIAQDKRREAYFPVIFADILFVGLVVENVLAVRN